MRIFPLALAAGLAGLPTSARADLDVVFVLDTTGSMGNELSEAKTRITQIAAPLERGRPGERLRYGVVAFRDRKDAYRTQASPLSEGVDTARRFLEPLAAGGGGDTPEDVLAALEVAIETMAWAQGAEHRVILVGDAPPHLDYPDGPRPEDLVRSARARGVVVDTIGCRSLAGEGRTFFRRFAYATEGRYQHIGRVEDEGGVASSVVEALAQRQTPTEPVGFVRREGPTPEGAGGWLEQAGCRLQLNLPAGFSRVQRVLFDATGEGRVVVEVAPGDDGPAVLELERCVPSSASLEIEVAS